MIVTRNTKISKILRENMDAIEVIATINKHFKKLKNPVLRRVLAPRVTVKDAAKIGNISTNTFLKHLEAAGFQVVYEQEEASHQNPDNKNLTLDRKNVVLLDVRPIILAGNDPFADIMKAIKNLKKGQTLELINVFEPTPIIQILEEKGYKSWTEKIDSEEYHTYFSKQTNETTEDSVLESPIEEGSFEEKLLSYGENLREIDVQYLEMPEPMVTILKEIDQLPEGYVLLVHHKKVPQFLLPELKTRNYTWMHKEIGPRQTDLLIFKE